MPERKKIKLTRERTLELTEEDQSFIEDAMKNNFERMKPSGVRWGGKTGCSCEGCSCPAGSGDICDAGTYVGYAGGFYGGSLGIGR